MNKLKNWFLHKEHPHNKIRLQKLINDSIIGFILFILLSIIYSNITGLNEHKLIFIKFGSALLLLCAFFSIKYTFKIIKNVYYGYKGFPNGFKLIILIIIAILVWKGYTNQEKYIKPTIEKIQNFDFLIINPFFIPEIIEEKEPKPYNEKQNGYFDEIKEKFDSKTSEKESIKSLEYINQKRIENGKKQINFDKRVYDIALARAKDMETYGYLDHTNPITGECPDNIKTKYGLKNYEYVAENAFGTTGAFVSPNQAVDSWMTSRGHRYNLLYDNHISGAIACYGGYCAFLGLNRDLFGIGCHTGAEGQQFWKTVGTQPGEI